MTQSRSFEVAAAIEEARSLPAWVYSDRQAYEKLTDSVLARSWHLVEVPGAVPSESSGAPGAWPAELLPGSLDEPVLFARDEDGVCRLLSNVCTHRGRILLDAGTSSVTIRCPYHGRGFDLCGRVRGAPGFDGPSAPTSDEDLPRIPTGTWGPLRFAAVDPLVPLDEWLEPLAPRLGHLPLDRLEPWSGGSRDYDLSAHWALYCDNYLEGLHIPFVHPALGQQLDWPSYRTQLFPWGSLQMGVGKEGGACFDLPDGHPDAGSRIGAFYFWLFPTTMVNVYPWGVSVNAVQPLGPSRTRVCFRAFTWDGPPTGEGAGGDLATVELEDEEVVEAVQRGILSKSYRPGRYAPSHEVGVHHFHRLLARLWNGS